MNEETNRTAPDRRDAVVIGATVEGLVAAAVLAKAGRSVVVLEREADPTKALAGEDAVIDTATARALDLVSHGLRFAPPPPIAGVAGDRSLILWPDAHAARASIAAFSPRDAEALDAFHMRVARAASLASEGERSAVAWLTSPAADEPDDATMFRLSSVARLLDETFDNDLLKGILAQGAIAGTGASPLAPTSGVLLARASLLASAAPELGHRFVAGGKIKLVQALLSALRFYNNAEVRFAAPVAQIATEREAAHAVVLADGTSIQTSTVVSSLSARRSRELLAGLRRPAPLIVGLSSAANLEPARVRLSLGAIPRFPGIEAATLASGAIVRLAPSIGRLMRAHGAFRGRVLPVEPCLDARLTATTSVGEGKQRWEMIVSMSYLPPLTTEGPWVGQRRDRLRTLCIRALDAIAPGFGASIDAAEIVYPTESQTVMDPRGAAALSAKAALDITGVPDARGADAPQLVKGVSLLEPSIYGGEGDAGVLAANAALGPRGKALVDA